MNLHSELFRPTTSCVKADVRDYVYESELTSVLCKIKFENAIILLTSSCSLDQL